MVTNTVDPAPAAVPVPESAADDSCTVGPLVVVTVERVEHHSVLVTERITNVTRVPGYQHHVVGCLVEYNERTVLGPVPAAIGTQLQIKSQLRAAVCCQLMQQVVADPEAVSEVAESGFILRPRTVEDAGSANVLLDEHRKTVSCGITYIDNDTFHDRQSVCTADHYEHSLRTEAANKIKQ